MPAITVRPATRPDAAPNAAFLDFVIPPAPSAMRRARKAAPARAAAWHLAAVLSLLSSCGVFAVNALLHMGR